jgi:hypothetical protein
VRAKEIGEFREIRENKGGVMPKRAVEKYALLEVDMEPVELTGKVILISKPNDYGNKDGNGYTSKPVLNPTWEYLCELADEALTVTGDRDHNALADINLVDTLTDGTEVYEFRFDS